MTNFLLFLAALFVVSTILVGPPGFFWIYRSLTPPRRLAYVLLDVVMCTTASMITIVLCAWIGGYL